MIATHAPAMAAEERRVAPIVAAVPGLAALGPHSGIGRVLTNLRREWGDRVRAEPAHYRAPRLPVLRNVPFGIDLPPDSDVVLLPQLTGAAALRGVAGTPSLVIVHDVGIIDTEADRLGMGWLTRRSVLASVDGLRHASRIVAVSRFTAERLLEHLPEVADRTAIVSNGVDDRFLAYRAPRFRAREAVARLAQQPLAEPVLVYVGSEQPRKNVGLLLDAFRRVRDVHPNAQLIKVGRPGNPRWRAATLERAARLGLRPGLDLFIVEDIDDDDLAHVYRAADLFVSASSYEGFGLPALEAMAVGTPVVVSRRGAYPEVTAGVGWLAEPEADAFAATILAALADPARAARAVAAQAVAATMSWKRAADAYLTLLAQLSQS